MCVHSGLALPDDELGSYTATDIGAFSATDPKPAWRLSAIEGAAVMVVSVPRIEHFPADFVGIQTLAHFGGITAGNFFQLLGCRCRGRSRISYRRG